MPGVRVRLATPDEAAPLAAFAARLFTDTYVLGDASPIATSRPADVAAYVDAHFTPDQQRAELRDPALVTLVAEVAGEHAPTWAGYAQLRLLPSGDAPTPPACEGASPRELARLYVDRAWHGQGVAGALMDAVQTRARAVGGADPLWLAVYQANARAVAFYRRRGFVVIGEATFTMGTEVQRDWLMTWRG